MSHTHQEDLAVLILFHIIPCTQSWSTSHENRISMVWSCLSYPTWWCWAKSTLHECEYSTQISCHSKCQCNKHIILNHCGFTTDQAPLNSSLNGSTSGIRQQICREVCFMQSSMLCKEWWPQANIYQQAFYVIGLGNHSLMCYVLRGSTAWCEGILCIV